MPRKAKSAPQPMIPSNALVASATRYPGKAPRIYQPKQDWQAECYRHYAICGEARFAAKFFGHAISRAVLHAATLTPDGPERQTEGTAAELLSALFNGADGQKQMLEAIGQHFTIAGECYLVGRTVAEDTDIWEIVSCIEMEITGNQWKINRGVGSPILLTEEDVVIRLWLPHPARSMEADSPFRALLPILSEIEWLTRHVYAQVTSRLAGAGILLMPQGMSFPPPPEQDGVAAQTANDADAFMLTLAEAMMKPIQDPGSPSALVPIVVTAPDEAIDKPRLLQFWSELDANSLSLRSEAIRRFALGMDLPPEQVLGMASNNGTGGGTSNGVSHWGAWQIEEATIKMHVEPMLDSVVNGLTMGYLRPGFPEGDEQALISVIIYDTSALRLRPDRSKEAMELYDRGLIKATTVIRETGFKTEDMPDEQEFHRWLLIKVASGSSTPEQVQAALAALGVPLAVAPPVAQGQPREARPDPSLEDHPSKPRTPAESNSASLVLLAASEALVFRALERAGNRLRQNVAAPPGIPSYETHMFVKANGSSADVLTDAWPTAPMVLDGIADPDEVIPVLNSYCQTLLAEQSPHSRTRLSEWLGLVKV